MAASKPISWLYSLNTSLFSLNNNFGTLNTCSGLFPFRHTTLSSYVWLFNIHHCPSESKYSPIKSSRSPDVYKKIFSNKICLRSQFCTCYDINWITYLYRFRRKPAILVRFVFHYTYHNFSDIYATITRSDFIPNYSKITRLRV